MEKIFGSSLVRPAIGSDQNAKEGSPDRSLAQDELLVMGSSTLKGELLKRDLDPAKTAGEKKPLHIHLTKEDEGWLQEREKDRKKPSKSEGKGHDKDKHKDKDKHAMTFAERVAARYLREIVAYGRFTIQREHYLPPEIRNTAPTQPEGTDLAIWTWEETKKDPHHPEGAGIKVIMGICFAGKSNKPLWHYRFHSEGNRNEQIRKTVEARKQTIERKQKERAEKASFVHGLKPGDIMVCSWGYDQTNIDFYQVTDVRGKNVIIREIASKVVESSEHQDTVVPVKDHFIGEPMVKRPGGTTGHPSIAVHSFASAHLWDGKPEHQTGPYSGH